MSDYLANNTSEAERLVLQYLAEPRPDLKDLIIVHYAGLVERTAKRYVGIEPLEDLVQVGFIGLLNALSKYDENAGVKFNTYATHLIAGEIKHYLRDKSQTIRMPAWLQELRARVNKCALDIQAQTGRVPTDREIADVLGMTSESVAEIYYTNEILKVTSLDQTISESDEGDSDIDKLDAGDFCAEQLSVEDRVLLEHALAELRDLEREVLSLFHFDSLNQTEIASRLGISCNYVSHILRQSLNKLKRILNKQDLGEEALREVGGNSESQSVDAHTGVYSEAYFKRRATEEIHRAIGQGGVVTVMYVRLCGLEKLNAFYGPEGIREMIFEASELIKDNIRTLDILCRYGKSGFALILPATGPSAVNLEQRLLDRFDSWIVQRVGPRSPMSIQLVHAIAPDNGRSLAELNRHLADLAHDAYGADEAAA